MLVKLTPGADAINISGLLNPKQLGNFKNQMLYNFFSSLDSHFLEIWESRLRSDKWFPNFTPNSYLEV